MKFIKQLLKQKEVIMSFIKLDRSIVDSYCFANPNHLKIWIWMLTKANFKSKFAKLKISKSFITIEVKRGQFIFGRLKASEELDMSESIIRRTLDKFISIGQIKVEKTSHYSIITICNYESYQSKTAETDQPTTNQEPTNDQARTEQEPTNDQPTTTSKEGLEGEESKESNKYLYENFDELPSNYIQSVIEQFKIQKQQTISSDEILKMWDVFKLQNLTGTNFYNNEYAVYKHFVNWIKNQNFNNGTNSKSTTKNRTTADERFEFYTNYASQFSDGSDEIKKD